MKVSCFFMFEIWFMYTLYAAAGTEPLTLSTYGNFYNELLNTPISTFPELGLKVIFPF